MWLPANALTKALAIARPILLGPFGGGLSSTALAACVSNLGGLGSYGAHYMSPTQITEVTAELRRLTDKPFAINLWVSDHDPAAAHFSPADFERHVAALRPIYERLGMPLPEMPPRFGQRFEEQLEAVFAAKPPVLSFVFGCPTDDVIHKCRGLGIKTVGTATTVAEAKVLDAAGVDAIVVTGFEAGGHRGSFLAPAEASLHGTFSLVQLAVAAVNAPLVAAGGIVNGKGVAAAMQLGASGVQVGTAFLACDESGATDAHKQLLRSGGVHAQGRERRTVLTRAFTGRLARGLENDMTVQGSDPATLIAPYPVQTWLTGRFKAAAQAQGQLEYVSLWASQCYPLCRHTKAADVFRDLTTKPEPGLLLW